MPGNGAIHLQRWLNAERLAKDSRRQVDACMRGRIHGSSRAKFIPLERRHSGRDDYKGYEPVFKLGERVEAGMPRMRSESSRD